VDLDPHSLPAWEGIAEVEVAEGHQAKAVESYRRLVSTLTTFFTALICVQSSRHLLAVQCSWIAEKAQLLIRASGSRHCYAAV
jgi:hypothetical protein